jgi:Alpha/beta hydrolase domain
MMTRGILKIVSISIALQLIHACSHPIQIVGEGDVTSAPGNRNCSLEEYNASADVCSKNYVIGAYNETYTATPRVGWQFDHWGNYCTTATTTHCSFNVAAATVQQFWGQTMPPLQAVFAKYKLTGPILPDSGINIAPAYLAQLGYQKKEFFLAGTARSYTPTLPLPTDGKLVVTADPEIAAGNYKTRLVVFRPIDPAKFNGTVVVEWLNVSAGADSNPDWIMAHKELIREGYAYVGVSAQAVGVNALKNGATTAARYGSLVHPGDSYSYDMFSRAGLLASEPSAMLLSGLTADRVLAVGESQSAFRLVTYIDAVQPIEHVYDGFLVHSRFGSGAAISQAPLPTVNFPAPAPIRDDLDVPVMVVQSEGDVIISNLDSRQPANTSMIREWEMAGTAHADAYTLAGLNDNGDGSAALAMFGYLRAPNNPFGCTNAINAGAHHWIVQAAFHGLNNWVRTGVAPSAGPPLNVISSSPVVLARDSNGNALGGVRSPHVDAPLATLDSVNSVPPGGFVFCGLFGRTIPFSSGRVLELYPTQADFTAQWLNSINANVANGFMLQVDGDALSAAANAWQFPN